MGIIGIVAALTMPTLIDNYQKKVTAKKLARFYSIMSQAVLRWENDEGIIPEDFKFEDTKGTYIENWFRSSIGKYIQTTSIKSTASTFTVAFNDGSGFDAYTDHPEKLFIFYCVEYKYCKKNSHEGNFNGKTGFLFVIDKGEFLASIRSSKNRNREELLNSCKYGNHDDTTISSIDRRHDCTKLIQIDGWEIKDDYPWQQIMLEN